MSRFIYMTSRTTTWTQEHKSVWYGPHRRLYGPRPQASARLARAAVVPQASAQASARTRAAGHCADQRASPGGDFLEIGHFAPFSEFLTHKGSKFSGCFVITSRLPMTAINHEKFHGNRSARFWEIRKTDRHTHTHTHTHRCGNFLYRYSSLRRSGNEGSHISTWQRYLVTCRQDRLCLLCLTLSAMKLCFQIRSPVTGVVVRPDTAGLR